MLGDTYVVDATMHDDESGVLCFCPVEVDDDGNLGAVIVGLSILSSEPPAGARVVGVFHAGGDEAAADWCASHQATIAALTLPDIDAAEGQGRR